MSLNLLRPMIDKSRFERKKTVTLKEGEEDGRRGWISILEEENGTGLTYFFHQPVRWNFRTPLTLPEGRRTDAREPCDPIPLVRNVGQ